MTILLLAFVGVLQSAALSPDEVQRAIAEGTRAKKMRVLTVKPGTIAFSPYTVYVVGPYGRVHNIAAEAARQLQPVPAMPALALEARLDVRVIPRTPSTPNGIPLPVQSVVMRYKASGQVIQPLTSEVKPYEWGNALGGRAASAGIDATFPPLTQPGDVEIVVVNANRTIVHTLKAKDREQIR